MAEFVGEAFEDFGNSMECVVSKIGGYEILDNGMIRIFLCKQFHGRLVLDHTTIISRSEIRAVGKKMIEIADAQAIMPEWAIDAGLARLAS